MSPSLFKRIGGDAAVEAAVNRFYEKFLAQEQVNVFFKDIDVDRQKEKLRYFFGLVLGGSQFISITKFKEIHRPLIKKGLTKSHVDLWMSMMQETLVELDIPEVLISEFIEACEPYEAAIFDTAS
ncbi:MAG: group 1 truncated hemoglobin [Kangiellaceae bacterium]|nr:group 1 truncated hemoglobin [Kangiellaceae bacterium]MCW9000010.1 group 1 truncated hemoglobin [Kangiellaceae bacterium]MCW9018263.1 group 1 truncated hemoglobin [Kangiellaceae bacterium]